MDDVFECVLGGDRDGFIEAAKVRQIAALQHAHREATYNPRGDVLCEHHGGQRVVVWLLENFKWTRPRRAVLQVRALLHLEQHELSNLQRLRLEAGELAFGFLGEAGEQLVLELFTLEDDGFVLALELMNPVWSWLFGCDGVLSSGGDRVMTAT